MTTTPTDPQPDPPQVGATLDADGSDVQASVRGYAYVYLVWSNPAGWYAVTRKGADAKGNPGSVVMVVQDTPKGYEFAVAYAATLAHDELAEVLS